MSPIGATLLQDAGNKSGKSRATRVGMLSQGLLRPGQAVEAPPSFASRKRCLAVLPVGLRSRNGSESGNRGPAGVAQKLPRAG
jgi:hypothetical protein